MLSLQYCIFGLSGAGKTTFINESAKECQFKIPRFVVTRPPRADDDPGALCHVSREAFEQMRQNQSFFFDADDGVNFYGYLNQDVSNYPVVLLYGLPPKISEIKRLGIKCILIHANANHGLSLRNDPEDLRQRRESANVDMNLRFYDNPVFLNQMDFILHNTYADGMGKLVSLFRQFVYVNRSELRALKGDIACFKFVLEIHCHPLEGMRSQASYWVRRAFENKDLTFLFYSRLLSARNRI